MKSIPTPDEARSALHTRLEQVAFCDEADYRRLDDLLLGRRELEPGAFLFLEDTPLEHTAVVLSGWAIRYKSFDDGRRQILEILLPGDIIGMYAVMLRRADSGIEALTPLTVGIFPASEIITITTDAPRLALSLGWLAGQGERRLDEHVSRVGRRGAAERMAHLFVELYLRLRRIGVERSQCGRFPLTQAILADILGMSHVHANRTFRALARDGLVTAENGEIVLRDIARLAIRCQFDPTYLEQPEAPEDVQTTLAEAT